MSTGLGIFLGSICLWLAIGDWGLHIRRGLEAIAQAILATATKGRGEP